MRTAKRVWLATDCDREGQLIGQEILEHYEYRGQVMRVLFTAQDSQTIRDAFGRAKPNAALTVTEGAMQAGLTKALTYYSPDRHPDRAQERLAYVLARMQEGGDAAQVPAKSGLPQMVAYDHAVHRDSGYYFLDHVSREARTLAGIPNLTTASTTRASQCSRRSARETPADSP